MVIYLYAKISLRRFGNCHLKSIQGFNKTLNPSFMTQFCSRGRMKIQDVPFMTTDWNQIPVTQHPGETGSAQWKTIEVGNIRVRFVEYTPGYRADHWCSRGHVLMVLEGELVTELKDGRSFNLRSGMSYQVATDAEPHRSSTAVGAKIFIVD